MFHVSRKKICRQYSNVEKRYWFVNTYLTLHIFRAICGKGGKFIYCGDIYLL